MKRGLCGMPRSDIRIVTWCRLSGDNDQKSHIAVGDRTSLNDLFNILKEEAGSDIEPEYGPDRAGDIRDSLADISKAERLLGYKPQVRIREGLRQTLDWFKNNQEFIYQEK